MLEVDTVLQLKEEFVPYKLDVGEGMFWLFNIETGVSFRLNETSYRILSLFDGNKSIGEIYKCVLDEYTDADTNVLSKDFEELIERMEKENIFKEMECK